MKYIRIIPARPKIVDSIFRCAVKFCKLFRNDLNRLEVELKGYFDDRRLVIWLFRKGKRLHLIGLYLIIFWVIGIKT